MVIRVKSSFSTGRVAIAKSGQQVSSLEKWKTDWFHEISELFQVTTDQIGQSYSTTPTLEKARAIESKARLSIVLSLIERYFRGQLTVTPKYIKPVNSNLNNSSNAILVQKKQDVRFMPWTMVNPKEVCPVDYVHQSRNTKKQTWNIDEAMDILTSADSTDDNLLSDEGSTSNESPCNDLTQIDKESLVKAPTLNKNKPCSNNTILLVVRPSNKLNISRKRKHENGDTIYIENQERENNKFTPNKTLAPTLIRLPREQQLSIIEKLANERQKESIGSPTVRRKNERSTSVDETTKINFKEKLKNGNMKELKRSRCFSQQPNEHRLKENQFKNWNRPGLLKENDDGLIKLDDIFALNGEDDVTLTLDDVKAASFDVQSSLSSLFPSCGLESGIGNESETLKGILEASDIVNRPQKRKYNKQPKPVSILLNSENEFPKPTLPYNQLIYLSFKESSFLSLTVRQIYKFITTTFPYYKTANQTWQNAVRHQLCCCKDYIKIVNPASQQGEKPSKYAWKIKDDESIKKLETEMIAHLAKGKDLKGIQNGMKNTEMFNEIFGDILPQLNGGAQDTIFSEQSSNIE